MDLLPLIVENLLPIAGLFTAFSFTMALSARMDRREYAWFLAGVLVFVLSHPAAISIGDPDSVRIVLACGYVIAISCAGVALLMKRDDKKSPSLRTSFVDHLFVVCIVLLAVWLTGILTQSS